MRRRAVVVTAALIAVVALAGLPDPAGSAYNAGPRAVESAAFTAISVPAVDVPVETTLGVSDAALRSDGHLAPDAVFVEPGSAPAVRARRPAVTQPAAPVGSAWKEPKYTISGFATFYDHGTTAMRLPYGTVVRICGDGGCIQRTITDYGPAKKSRIVDLYRPDFFKICGCEWFAGSTRVTVSVY